ncbi:ribosomal protein S30 [Drepanopeziza brunnea f. sp. 'multigermtubi' MB_m1]|uniref:Ribosomal protein S30 n=1 Tax=Marssonina brunnea f. sp. multigermtubi (strain MB_m1) TaxID=1072389 RepID=K1XPN1_MARBU|nr:ribosomal protein S30 [Drepanopeziza brunnea f. sp. 'multigermtubi' MB_m1]EKD14484.1 ribosomal protein S30 [Drepanopeziza brunnea f. sp. 'multigermtubi' MB_m1]
MGKVHGSLARAGKVKSQTPKVEPQEKKKTPKGRAKKRITYTRRFVNVTLTGGKRKPIFGMEGGSGVCLFVAWTGTEMRLMHLGQIDARLWGGTLGMPLQRDGWRLCVYLTPETR